MTKSMLEKCLNKEMRAFCALDGDVREAIKKYPNYSESLWEDQGAAIWIPDVWCQAKLHFAWRLSPDTPTEPEYEERPVELFVEKWFGVVPITGPEQYWILCACLCHKRFIGIIYTLNGVETLRTSVDAAFGTPVRVRFAKGE